MPLSWSTELKEAVEAHGLRVWFDDAVLTIGDSLRRSIDRGLRRSVAGVAILSPAFFRSRLNELNQTALTT